LIIEEKKIDDMLSIRTEPILTLIIEIKVYKVSEENFYCFFFIAPNNPQRKKNRRKPLFCPLFNFFLPLLLLNLQLLLLEEFSFQTLHLVCFISN